VANRYTDMDKWEDDWFLKLSPKMKCAWQYLCDTVNGCGDRRISLTKFSNDIGEGITREEFDQCFTGRVFWIDEDIIWVPGTLKRIYKTLSPKVPAHVNAARKVLRITEGLKLSDRGLKVRSRFQDFLETKDQEIDSWKAPDQALTRGQSVPDLKEKREESKENREQRKEKREKRNTEEGAGETKVLSSIQKPEAINSTEKFESRFSDFHKKFVEEMFPLVPDRVFLQSIAAETREAFQDDFDVYKFWFSGFSFGKARNLEGGERAHYFKVSLRSEIKLRRETLQEQTQFREIQAGP